MLYTVPVPFNRRAFKGTAHSGPGLVSRKLLMLQRSTYNHHLQCMLQRSNPLLSPQHLTPLTTRVFSSTSSSHQLVLLGFGANPAYIPEIHCIAQDLLVFFPTRPCSAPCVRLAPISLVLPRPWASSQLARLAVFSRSSGIV